MEDHHTRSVKITKKYCPTCYGQFEGSVEVCTKDKTPLRSAENDPLIGQVFADKYTIDSILGFGGMSVVYRGKHRLMNRVVAIKMLHNKLKSDASAMERFKVEAQAASSLSHQNVVSVYDFGISPEGEPYFVMDCLEGESLGDLIERKGKLPYERAIPIFKQICDGLEAAHRKGIVHRDLKPANVILLKMEDGTEMVKLVDFGIAKVAGVGQSQRLTQTGEVFGSPIYMSPEQCSGKELDNRSDIYALGCVMYETLTGTPPFEGISFLETMNLHVGENARSMNSMAPDAKVPRELEEVIVKCIAKKPIERFQTATELRDSLSAVTHILLGHSGKHPGGISGKFGGILTGSHAGKPEYRPSMAVILSSLFGSIIIFAIIFVTCWQGTADDKGTYLNKLIWQWSMENARTEISRGKYEEAEKSLANAEARTLHFGDGQSRFLQTLHLKAELYSKWESHSELLEMAVNDINNIENLRTESEFKQAMDLVAQLDRSRQGTLNEGQERTIRLKAEAQIRLITKTAVDLASKNMREEEEQLLKQAVDVERHVLGRDAVSLAPLDTLLADCYSESRKYGLARPLLEHALHLRKSQSEDQPSLYAQALNKIGQFDLEQNEVARAGTELDEALKLANSLQGLKDKELKLKCMRSYADLLLRQNKRAEADAMFKQADDLEKKHS